jgi:hypothetical protein
LHSLIHDFNILHLFLIESATGAAAAQGNAPRRLGGLMPPSVRAACASFGSVTNSRAFEQARLPKKQLAARLDRLVISTVDRVGVDTGPRNAIMRGGSNQTASAPPAAS